MKSWPMMEDSPWRQPYLVELTFGEIYRLVNRFVRDRKLRILDVGCGRGFLSLELARNGHDVVGIDADDELIKMAIRLMRTDPYRSSRGVLEYQVSDFSSWRNPGKMFDLVIFSRVLHHIPRPGKVLEKVQRLLASRGRVICIEYAYDQFERRSATWLYHILRALEQAGWFSSKKPLSDDSRASVGLVMKDWQAHGREEHLNRFREMYSPLKRLFRERHFSWEPYVFWSVITDMRVPTAQTEMSVARSLRAMEKALIDKNAISPVLFCFVGEKVKGQ